MLEQSFQARFLIPMAISITAGLLSSTVLTLWSSFRRSIVILDDIQRVLYRLSGTVAREIPIRRRSPPPKGGRSCRLMEIFGRPAASSLQSLRKHRENDRSVSVCPAG